MVKGSAFVELVFRQGKRTVLALPDVCNRLAGLWAPGQSLVLLSLLLCALGQ